MLQKEKQEIFTIQEDLGCLIDLVDAKNSELQEKQEEIERLMTYLDNEEEEFIGDLEEKVELMELLQRENEEICDLSQRLEENCRVLSGINQRIRELEVEERELKLASKGEEVRKSDCLEVLETQVSNLRGLANTYRHDIEKMRAGRFY